MIEQGVPLAPFTTLELGGPAEYFVRAGDRATLVDALRWAHARGLPVRVIGGGSNLVIADEGLPGLTIKVETRGVRSTHAADGCVELEVDAGEPWDKLVERSVEEDLAGLECLSGIPGLAGATPIQNVGAYGQEVAETVRRVELLERDTLQVVTHTHAHCGFSYRDSNFKREPDRWVVLSVTFALRKGGAASLRYAELARAVAGQATLRETRRAVLELRRNKSMVLDPSDENRRSVGSFFLNPVLRAEQLGELAQRAQAAPPVFAADGGSKVPAAWLIERAGFTKGQRTGHVGISSRHALALVHHGGGTSVELLGFARLIRDQVRARFGVTLEPEARLLGLTM
ncbi:MAG TPA: UDP-N-acetylmuramate dehydrogenase [Polyangiales bacterium]|nr:UDP-N-acetylmuramate dehydrogenase [Polyangiales bacterium]